MANPIAIVWSDPPTNPPTTVDAIDFYRIHLFRGSTFILSADVLPSIGRWTIPALGPGEFTAKVYAMAGGKYATVADVVTWTVEGDPPGSPPTPSDGMIPPVEDAALEYEA